MIKFKDFAKDTTKRGNRQALEAVLGFLQKYVCHFVVFFCTVYISL